MPGDSAHFDVAAALAAVKSSYNGFSRHYRVLRQSHRYRVTAAKAAATGYCGG